MNRILTFLPLMLLSLLAGCATVQYPYSADLQGCRRDNLGFAFIPDFGVTNDYHIRKCMREEGWMQTPPREWPRFGVPGYRRMTEQEQAEMAERAAREAAGREADDRARAESIRKP